jgi:serine/threonine-protein kinase
MHSLSRFLRTSSLLLLAAIILSALSSTASAATTYYCAIAFSPKTGGYGISYNHLSAESARLAAIRNCYARTRDARPATFGAHNAWAALAVGAGNGYGWGWGTTKQIAEANALASCRKFASGARIRVSVKSMYPR